MAKVVVHEDHRDLKNGEEVWVEISQGKDGGIPVRRNKLDKYPIFDVPCYKLMPFGGSVSDPIYPESVVDHELDAIQSLLRKANDIIWAFKENRKAKV